jgi:hypothetical protein
MKSSYLPYDLGLAAANITLSTGVPKEGILHNMSCTLDGKKFMGHSCFDAELAQERYAIRPL